MAELQNGPVPTENLHHYKSACRIALNGGLISCVRINKDVGDGA